MNRIGTLPRVSAQSVLNGIRAFAREHYEKPEPTRKAIILELEKMWHYLKNRRHEFWIWKALESATSQLLDWECGHREGYPEEDGRSARPMGREVLPYRSQWGTYAPVLPQDKLAHGKVGAEQAGREIWTGSATLRCQ